MSSDSDENIHYISDQESADDNPEIELIIREKFKLYPNQKYAVKILLSEHFQKFRNTFFKTYENNHLSYIQGVKNEIRNNLNPYRIFVKKSPQISEDLKNLYELLKNYYKEKNFNNDFFINYFLDLKKSHKSKSNLLYQLPSNVIETLNDIERRVEIIRHLRHHLNTTIRDRIQKNFYQEKVKFNDKIDTKIMYKYLVIKDDAYKNMTFDELEEKIKIQKVHISYEDLLIILIFILIYQFYVKDIV